MITLPEELKIEEVDAKFRELAIEMGLDYDDDYDDDYDGFSELDALGEE